MASSRTTRATSDAGVGSLSARTSVDEIASASAGRATASMTGRYIKNLPVPRGTTARETLEAYLAAEIGDLEP
jgi:hypothetical protein